MTAPWIAITDYPTWPSPYFQQLDEALPTSFGLAFQPSLDEITRRFERPGFERPPVVNLHRLARLYRGSDGRPDRGRAAAMITRLDEVLAIGGRLVWTVHNLLPIRVQDADPLDERVTSAVLARADALIAHTVSDARALRGMRPGATVMVGGSAGLDAIPERPATAQITRLADQLGQASTGVLMLGNIDAYKGLPEISRVFLDSTAEARLVIAGRPADLPTVALLKELESRAGGRLALHADYVPPGNARLLCQAATALLCPYRADGPFEFFRRALHPSSVSMAAGFAVPVIAPDLPSIRELTEGNPRALYASAEQAAQLFARLDTGERPWDAPPPRPVPVPVNRWPGVAQVYLRLAAELTTPPADTPLA
jgi:beta-1,4-mannosyltransferase